MGVLDPVDLPELAAHLRDGTWLDMRVIDVGTVERARVAGIIVRRDDEELILEQEHSFDGAVQVSTLNVPRDSVRWCRPSCFELEDVEVTQPKVKEGVDDVAVVNTVKDVLVFAFKDHKTHPLGSRKAVERMLKQSPYDHVFTHHRHVFVYLIWRYHSGQMSPATICGMAGYKSQMPWQSAKWKFEGKGRNVTERDALDKMMAARGFTPVRGET